LVSTYVLVHGAWHGGWCWRKLVPLLEAEGHRVTTPTLTGLGERSHLAARGIDLNTHITDVVKHLEYEGLSDVVLVAHSYAGFVAYGMAEQGAAAIAHLVLLDGFVPMDGEAVADHVGERGTLYREEAAKDPGWTFPPPPPGAFGVTEPQDIEWTQARLTEHPVMSYVQPLQLSDAIAALQRKTYISCTTPALAVLDESKRRIGEDDRWRLVEMACGHDAMIAAPRELAGILTS
jgi:pimeloyl-ACP methyl ester carboxylesterase